MAWAPYERLLCLVVTLFAIYLARHDIHAMYSQFLLLVGDIVDLVRFWSYIQAKSNRTSANPASVTGSAHRILALVDTPDT